jgi:hypothetical protein
MPAETYRIELVDMRPRTHTEMSQRLIDRILCDDRLAIIVPLMSNWHRCADGGLLEGEPFVEVKKGRFARATSKQSAAGDGASARRAAHSWRISHLQLRER